MDVMFEIVQGGNTPVSITFPEDVSKSVDMHVGIYDHTGYEVMHWSKDALDIKGAVVSCPVTQDESVKADAGIVYLETKRTDENGRVHVYERVTGRIVGRYDHHVIVEEVIGDV